MPAIKRAPIVRTFPGVIRGRGATSNVAHRFQRDERERADDGWSVAMPPDAAASVPDGMAEGGDPADPWADAAAPLRTTVATEQAASLLSWNQSPDIPFDRAANPYRGCEHGCVYCYARPTHAYLGYSPGLDFETRLVAKANAVEALRAELARPGYQPAPINIGSATDAYQPIERQWQLTRGLLALLCETRHPATIVTKSALIERDIDLLAELARQQLITVYISVTTLDAGMARLLEPRASAPWRRLAAVQALARAGVPVGVLVAPVIPFINDDQIEQILAAAQQAGASHASYTVLRLPWELREIFSQWLQAHFPDRAARVLHRIQDLRQGKQNDSTFGRRMRGQGIWADLLAQRFRLALRRNGLLSRGRLALNTGLFVPPSLNGQQSLF